MIGSSAPRLPSLGTGGALLFACAAISFPKNVKISQSADLVKVEEPKGTLSSKLPEGITIKLGDGSLSG